VTFEFHIDIGKRGETKALINEMVGMVSGLNFIPKIKPDSYCASCFATGTPKPYNCRKKPERMLFFDEKRISNIILILNIMLIK